jgi:hypothetical protein
MDTTNHEGEEKHSNSREAQKNSRFLVSAVTQSSLTWKCRKNEYVVLSLHKGGDGGVCVCVCVCVCGVISMLLALKLILQIATIDTEQ